MAEVKVLEINFGSTLEQINQVRAGIASLKKEREDLTEAVKAGTKTEAEVAKQTEALNATIRVQTHELKALERVADNTVRTNKAQAGSIAANRAELARLTAEYIKLGKPTAEQTFKIKQLSEELKKQESAIGDNRRSVGGYREAIQSVITTLPGGAAAMKAFGVATNAAAGPVGIITQAIQLLIGSLQKNETVIKILKSLTDGFAAVLQVVTDRVLKLATPLAKLFDDPIGSVRKLAEVISQSLLHPLDAVKNIFNAIIGFGKDVGKAFEETAKGSFAIEQLDDAQRELNEALAESRRLQAEQLVIAKDKTKSDEERLAAAQKIIELEDEASKKQIAAIENELKIREDALAGRKGTDEELNRLSELRVQLTERQTEALATQGKQQVRINQILEKGESQLTKVTEDELEKREKAQEQYNALIQKLTDEFLLDDREKLEKSFQDKLDAIKGQSDKEIELRKRLEEEKQKALDNFDAQLLAKKIEKENKAALDQLEADLIIARTAGEAAFQEQLAIEEERQRQIIENEKLTLEEKEKLIAESNERINQIADQQAELELQTAKVIQDAKFSIAESGAAALSSLLEIFGEGGEAAAKFQKALAIFDVAMAAAKSLAQIIPLAIQAASATGPAAPFVLGGYIAAAAATVLGAIAQSKKIISGAKEPKAPKFAEGGGIPVEGASHAEGGATVSVDGRPVAEVEGGERLFVLKKSASEQIDKLSAFNQLFGGRSWTGKPTRFAADGGLLDGGFTARSIGDSVNNQVETIELMKIALRNVPSPVVRVTEINQVQASVNQTVEVSSL